MDTLVLIALLIGVAVALPYDSSSHNSGVLPTVSVVSGPGSQRNVASRSFDVSDNSPVHVSYGDFGDLDASTIHHKPHATVRVHSSSSVNQPSDVGFGRVNTLGVHDVSPFYEQSHSGYSGIASSGVHEHSLSGFGGVGTLGVHSSTPVHHQIDSGVSSAGVYSSTPNFIGVHNIHPFIRGHKQSHRLFSSAPTTHGFELYHRSGFGGLSRHGGLSVHHGHGGITGPQGYDYKHHQHGVHGGYETHGY